MISKDVTVWEFACESQSPPGSPALLGESTAAVSKITHFTPMRDEEQEFFDPKNPFEISPLRVIMFALYRPFIPQGKGGRKHEAAKTHVHPGW
jgi:hypothetical protein